MLAQHAGRETQWLQQLSSRSRLLLFARDFLGGRKPFPVVETEHEGRPVFRLSLRQAAEFLSKKDYTDNWKSEMNEAFCCWSFAQWKEVLADIGFQVHENPNNPAESSCAYTNPWIVEHRYAGHVELLGEGKPSLPWPPTNMVLIAEKRMG